MDRHHWAEGNQLTEPAEVPPCCEPWIHQLYRCRPILIILYLALCRGGAHTHICECVSLCLPASKMTHKCIDGCWPNMGAWGGMHKGSPSRNDYILLLIRLQIWIQDHFSSFINITRGHFTIFSSIYRTVTGFLQMWCAGLCFRLWHSLIYSCIQKWTSETAVINLPPRLTSVIVLICVGFFLKKSDITEWRFSDTCQS